MSRSWPQLPAGPGLARSSAAPAVVRGSSCGWLRTRPPIPAQALIPADVAGVSPASR